MPIAPPLRRRVFPRLDDTLSFPSRHPELLGPEEIAEVRATIPNLPRQVGAEREAYLLLTIYAAGPVQPHHALIVQELVRAGWMRLKTEGGVLRWDRT